MTEPEVCLCLHCGAAFRRHRNKRQLFCSSSCRAMYWRKTHPEQQRIIQHKINVRRRQHRVYDSVARRAMYQKQKQDPEWLKRYTAQQLERKKAIRTYINRYKLEHGCSQCGYKEQAEALHFHHTDRSQKCRNISDIYSIAAFKKEVAKCIILCANCHACKTFDVATVDEKK